MTWFRFSIFFYFLFFFYFFLVSRLIDKGINNLAQRYNKIVILKTINMTSITSSEEIVSIYVRYKTIFFFHSICRAFQLKYHVSYI